ncbi:MAG: 50S ribosomal protein L23 [Clostridia bacterium]|nr:50S ribosomal protein L23 [Clostridia bacterium]
MKTSHDIIIRPIISEKSLKGTADKRYTFEVLPDATKPEIANAVEEVFGVKVVAVNTVNMKKKPKALGVHSGYTKAWKKAIVTLSQDSKSIEFFDGMI